MAWGGSPAKFTMLRKRTESKLCSCTIFWKDFKAIAPFLSEQVLKRYLGILLDMRSDNCKNYYENGVVMMCFHRKYNNGVSRPSGLLLFEQSSHRLKRMNVQRNGSGKEL